MNTDSGQTSQGIDTAIDKTDKAKGMWLDRTRGWIKESISTYRPQ